MVLAGALTERGHHLDRQTIELFPVDTFAAAPLGRPTPTAVLRASPTADSS